MKLFRIAVALSLAVALILGISVLALGATTNTSGSAAYSQYCAFCHGANGQGTQYGPDIQGEGGDTAEVVREGDDEMPAYGKDVIDDATLKALSSYVGSLGHSGDHEYGGAGGDQYGHDRDGHDDHESDSHNRDRHDREEHDD